MSRIEPDADVVGRLRDLTLTLPDAYEEDAWTGVRWRVRKKTFGHVMVAQDGYESSYREITGLPGPETIMTFHASGDELLALTHAGLPFYKPPWSPTIIGLVLGEDTDWTEVAELLTESFRICAPQKLVRLLDQA
ncbi:MmcQ/YjbR family DNA-binding protein [Nocardioides speluncae]|uniref:MmcQ/YjbR family DNA-binding protein n=1 Tax=Nocardioides speluncae TaxID=2670337 RepID=UPI000D69DA3E|nr:MmcQ/YjbR family DNA-binding protein [Nocardioides speluncae]